MSEDRAVRRIEVARVTLKVPEVLDHLADGRLSVTTACVLAPHLTPETAAGLLAASAFRSRQEIVRLLAERPRPAADGTLALGEPTQVVDSSSLSAPVRIDSLAEPCSSGECGPGAGPPAAAQANPPRRVQVRPSSSGGYDVRLSITDEEHDVLRRATALLGHSVPSEIACVNATIAGEALVTRIRDIVWIQPLRLAAEDHLVKTFLMSSGNETEFVIVSFNDDNERVVNSEGRVSYAGRCQHGDEAQASYSIEALKKRAEKTLSGSACYRQFENFGFSYGPCFRTIQELHIGNGYALARLDLAEVLKGDFEQYILHPCIIDGALQTVIGVAMGGESNTPHLPFAVDEVENLRPLTQTCYDYVEQVVSETSVTSEIKQRGHGLFFCRKNSEGRV